MINISRFIFIYIYLACVLAEVLNQIKSTMEKVPEPFPISKQYKNRAGGNGDLQDASVSKTQGTNTKGSKPKGPKSTENTNKKQLLGKVKAKKRIVDTGAYEPSVYADKRKLFMKQIRDAGHSHVVANCSWNLSQEKRDLLCDVPVTELKRRRFLPAGATTNPWAKKEAL